MSMIFAAWWVCLGWLNRAGSSRPPATKCAVGRAHSSQGCKNKESKQRCGDALGLNPMYSGMSVSPITCRSMAPCVRRGLMSSQAYPAAKRIRCRAGSETEPPSPAACLRQDRGLSPRPTATPWGQKHKILLLRKITSDPKHVQAWEAETARCTLRFPCVSIFLSAANCTDSTV